MTTRKKGAAKKRAGSRQSAQPKAKKTAKKRAAPKKKASKSRPKTGASFERTLKGEKHVVKVTADGFSYRGKTYRSLTAIAKVISQYASVSGPRFFGTATASKKGGKP